MRRHESAPTNASSAPVHRAGARSDRHHWRHAPSRHTASADFGNEGAAGGTSPALAAPASDIAASAARERIDRIA
jgi:hypothetical protein